MQRFIKVDDLFEMPSVVDLKTLDSSELRELRDMCSAELDFRYSLYFMKGGQHKQGTLGI